MAPRLNNDSAGSDSGSSSLHDSESNDSIAEEFMRDFGTGVKPIKASQIVDDASREEEPSDKFPVQEFVQVMDGLNRSPSWIVYPVHLDTCLSVSARILSHYWCMQETDAECIRRLIRECIPSAFEKCLDDQALYKWSEEIQHNIFGAITSLIDLVVAKLVMLNQEKARGEVSPETEDDMVPLLRALALAFDKTCCFHEKHVQDAQMPLDDAWDGNLYAHPIAVADADMEENERNAERCEEGFFWLVALLNHMGTKNGFDKLATALSQPERMSINLIKSLLLPISISVEFLSAATLQIFAQVCQRILGYVRELLDSDIEELSMRGADFTYSSASLLLMTAFDILERHLGSLLANKKVCEIQRCFIAKMLSSSNFNKHLSAVRETLKLLRRCHDLRSVDGGASLKENLNWLNAQSIVKLMLRGSLHQKQFVDQVQHILKYMLQEGLMTVEHLDILWSVTEKADTFETVKNNIYGLLVELAFDFSAGQLDLLFRKFEAAQCRPASDRIRMAQLLLRIAQSDEKAVMGGRVVGLLWSIVAAKDAPPEVTGISALPEAVRLYERRGSNVREELCLKCLELIGSDDDETLRGLTLLRQLVSRDSPGGEDPGKQGTGGNAKCVEKLIDTHRCDELILGNLEKFVEQRRGAVRSDGPRSSLDGGGEDEARTKGLSERTETLLFLMKITGRILPWEEVLRLWACLVSRPASPQDSELGYSVFREALPNGARSRVIDIAEARRILTEKFPEQPPEGITASGFACFESYFLAVGVAEGKLSIQRDAPSASSMDLCGISYLWRIATEVQCHDVAGKSCNMLMNLHLNLGPELKAEAMSIRRTLLEETLRKLLAAAGTVNAASPSDVYGRCLSDRRVLSKEEISHASFCALRCVHLLLDLLERCSSRTMPQKPSHLASYSAHVQRLDVTCSMPKSHAQRLSFFVSTSDYVGRLRQAVAARLGAPPEKIRLLSSGHELNSDAKLIRQVGIGDGHVISALVSDVPNCYTKPSPTEALDESPIAIITGQEGIFEALLSLADSPRMLQDSRQLATILLHTLPTWPAVPHNILTALFSDQPGQALGQLLDGAGPMPSMRRLYFIESLLSLLCPSGGASSALPTDKTPQQMMAVFLESGCLEQVLRTTGLSHDGGFKPCAAPDRHMLAQILIVVGVLLQAALLPTAARRASSLAAREESAEDIHLSTPRDHSRAGLASLSQSALKMVVHHLVNAACACGRGSGLPDESTGSDVLLEGEQVVVTESLKLLTRMATSHAQALQFFVEHPNVQQLVSGNLLNRHSGTVRLSLSQSLVQIFCSPDNARREIETELEPACPRPSGAFWLLRTLISIRPKAELQPEFCGDYFSVLLSSLKHLSLPHEVQAAEDLLVSEIESLKGARPPVSDSDDWLVGQLRLIQELIRTLNRQNAGSRHGCGLVNLLVTKLLFPEAVVLKSALLPAGSSAQGGQEADPMDPERVRSALHTPCSSAEARAAALDLLSQVMSGDPASLAEGVQLLFDLHYTSEPLWDYEHQPVFQRRVQQRFCGLKNAGATCYMNSTIQQLFMTEGLRRLLLEAEKAPDDHKADSVLYQLQVMFAHLALSSLDFYIPQQFWRAFKDYDGEPINLREHQDAFEFLTRLQDLVDQQLSDARQLKVMKETMGGKFAQQVICRGVSYRSETEQDFMSISVDIRGKHNLLESLSSYVQGELMEGENAYYCEGIGRKVDAVKRACVKTLPNTLVIHLKRFEFDFDTMMRWKVRDRFEFPMELNMYEYTVEGLAEAEGQQATDKRADDYYEYQLVGIVVHSGTAFVGHYYSYIKERSQGPSNGSWWIFDDTNVEAWDPSNLDRDCFGGRSVTEVYDSNAKQNVLQEYDRPNSAYLLVYERTNPICGEAGGSGGAGTAPEAVISAAEEPMETAGEADAAPVTGGRKGLVELDVPGIGRLGIQRSVYRDVIIENLQAIDEMHRFDTDYLHFMRHLVEVQSDLSHFDLSQRKMRRTETSASRIHEGAASAPASPAGNPPTPNGGGAASMSMDEGGGGGVLSPGSISAELSASTISEQRGEHVDKVATKAMELACMFLFKVYFRAHHSLRDDMTQWQSLMGHLMEAFPRANALFLHTMTASPGRERGGVAGNLICRMMQSCPAASVRGMFAHMLVTSLRHACQRQGGDVDVGQTDAPGALSKAVLDVLASLRLLIVDLWQSSPKGHVLIGELFHILREVLLVSPGIARVFTAMGSLFTQVVEFGYKMFHHCGPSGFSELGPLFECVAIMIRSSCLLERPGVDNPYLFPAPASGGSRPAVPPETTRFLLGNKFISTVIEGFLHSPEVLPALQAVMWEEPEHSHFIVSVTLDWMNICTANDLVRCIDNIASLVTIRDSLFKARLQVLFGDVEEGSIFSSNLAELAMATTADQGKCLGILQLVLVLAERASPELVGDLLNCSSARAQDWADAVQWLEQRVGSRGRESSDNPVEKEEQDVLRRLQELLVH
uniref:Ubiquitin carboxyl-terminal hydrolase 9/24 n=2 Tax=Tetraselmis sp. GSL018 TaxID=582737 RepID=A0A061RL24_9CHLO